MSSRIYATINKRAPTKQPRLVKAGSSSAVRNHVAKDDIDVWIPDAETLLACGKAGVTVEEIGEPVATQAGGA